jgi:hypothetical protein
VLLRARDDGHPKPQLDWPITRRCLANLQGNPQWPPHPTRTATVQIQYVEHVPTELLRHPAEAPRKSKHAVRSSFLSHLPSPARLGTSYLDWTEGQRACCRSDILGSHDLRCEVGSGGARIGRICSSFASFRCRECLVFFFPRAHSLHLSWPHAFMSNEGMTLGKVRRTLEYHIISVARSRVPCALANRCNTLTSPTPKK